MYFVKFLFSILCSIISTSCQVVFENNPIVFASQAVIEHEGILPISVFWYYPNITQGDQLIVYSSNSLKEYAQYTIEFYIGFYELPLTALNYGRNLDNYCVAILAKDGLLDDNPSCQSKLQWMYDRRDSLGDFSLLDLIIPGTHQSAAYGMSDYESLNDQSFISRWILCQTKSIKSQLMDGIRYLDLRPGYVYRDGKKKYITTHDVFNLISMDDVVEQINEFMDISKDIVIVAFHEFSKGFNSYDDHLSFINYLEHSFAKHASRIGFWQDPLRNLWKSDKRLILSYNHIAFKSSSLMWLPIPQYWANAQTLRRLHASLGRVHQNEQVFHRPYAVMVVFTHSMTTIIKDAVQGDMSLRHWAQRLSYYIPRWYIVEWTSSANIIAVDFYQTSGIVDLAIQLNDRRVERSRSKPRA